MKSLILVRHAKSSWDFGITDKQRSLEARGILAVEKVAKKVASILPENLVFWCSTAVRASETCKIFCETLKIDVSKINFIDKLYTFDESQLESEIKKSDDAIDNLILFGHNEAITNFVNKFGNKYIDNVPTAGFVFLQFEQSSWKNINGGKTIKTVFPKEI